MGSNATITDISAADDTTLLAGISGTGTIEVTSRTGTANTDWYNDTDPEFTIVTAEQFAGFASLIDEGNTFEGKTVKLNSDLNLLKLDANGNPICFEPIGSYRKDTPFKGTFDGQGHTISNLYQNTWALNNGYYYGDLGMGLFGKVEDATIKTIVMDGGKKGRHQINDRRIACTYLLKFHYDGIQPGKILHHILHREKFYPLKVKCRKSSQLFPWDKDLSQISFTMKRLKEILPLFRIPGHLITKHPDTSFRKYDVGLLVQRCGSE